MQQVTAMANSFEPRHDPPAFSGCDASLMTVTSSRTICRRGGGVNSLAYDRHAKFCFADHIP
jgi:hypothetical protein